MYRGIYTWPEPLFVNIRIIWTIIFRCIGDYLPDLRGAGRDATYPHTRYIIYLYLCDVLTQYSSIDVAVLTHWCIFLCRNSPFDTCGQARQRNRIEVSLLYWCVALLKYHSALLCWCIAALLHCCIVSYRIDVFALLRYHCCIDASLHWPIAAALMYRCCYDLRELMGLKLSCAEMERSQLHAERQAQAYAAGWAKEGGRDEGVGFGGGGTHLLLWPLTNQRIPFEKGGGRNSYE